MGNWIEICKTGTFTAKNGETVTITGQDINNIVSGFNSAQTDVPLVFGHPEDNHPAFGWVEKLERAGDILKAKFKQVPQAVKDLVAAGHYKKVSVSLSADKTILRHVGLLGAVQPAVPGLAAVKFVAGQTDLTLNFSNPKQEDNDVEKAELERKLAQEKTAREKAEADVRAEKEKAVAAESKATAAQKELSQSRKKAVETQVDARINKLVGVKIQAKDKPLVKKIALALGEAGQEIELSDGAGKKGLEEHLFDFLSGLPDLGLLHEFSAPDGQDKDAGVDTSDMMIRV